MSKRVVIAHLPWEGKDYLVHTLAEGERPVELTALCREKETLLGNIYVGRVEKLAPGIRGAFVSFAEQQSCFLDLSRVKGGYLLKKAPGTELHVGDEIVVQIQGKRRKRSFRRRQQNFLFREVPWRSIMESRKSHAQDAFCRSRKNG